MKLLLLDNYDSFTYNLYDYLVQCGADCTVVRNDALDLSAFDPSAWDGVVLSPGPGWPADAGVMPALIGRVAERLPVLGICLGHQALGERFGARLRRARVPVHGKTSVLEHDGHALFAGLPRRFSVMRYHSLLLDSLDNTPLEPLAYTADGELMALAHRELPLYGLQFHPESVLTQYGLEIIRNWTRNLHQR
jgi:anthranilate synthase/aminodeoxychorismate synthase-like glutamine amidotransferase